MGTRRLAARTAVSIGFALAVALLVPSGASAVDRYAEPGGNGPEGAGGCLSSDPCGLEDAIEGTLPADVVDGDRVLVLGGTHNTGGAELSINDNIVVEAAPGAGRPVINSTSASRAIEIENTAPNGVVRGLEIVHTAAAPGNGLGLSLVFGGTAERMITTSNGFLACGTPGGTLRDSVCILTAASTGVGAVGAVVGGNVSLTATVRNVTAISKAAATPALVQDANGGADLTMNARNVIAEGSPDANAITNSAASTSSTILLSSSAFTNTAFTGTNATVTAPGTGDNTAAAPQFVNFAGNDFHQLPTSPTIDRGTVDPFLGAIDLDGAARTQGAAPDIGAYEAPAPVTPIPIVTPKGPPGPNTNKCKAKKKKKKPKASVAAKKKKKKSCGKKPKKKQK